MADNSKTTPKTEAPAAPVAAAEEVEYAPVAAPANALIGDEAVQGAAKDVEVNVDTAAVPAQVIGKPSAPVKESPVNETYVKVDHAVLDPNSPEAVQIPDAGRGTTNLPIQGVAKGEKAEDVFAREASAEKN